MVPIEAGDELDLRHYLDVLRRRWWVVLGTTVIITAIAVALSVRQTPQYRASAELLLRGTEAETRLDSSANQGGVDRTRVDTEIGVLTSDLVRSQVAAELGRGPSISASGQGDTEIITVSSTSTDPEVAAETVNVYLDVYIDWKRESTVQELLDAQKTVQAEISNLRGQLTELEAPITALEQDLIAIITSGGDPSFTQAQLDDLKIEIQPDADALNSQITAYQAQISQLQVSQDVTATGGAQILSAASAPSQPFAPQPIRNGILGFVVGAMAGVGLAFVLETLDDRIRSKDDLERVTGWTAIGLIPAFGSKVKSDVVTIADPTGSAAEAYRALRTAILFLGIERELRVIQVTSPKPSDGKTTVAANLAVVLARTGKKVLLVDADLRRPRLHEEFGIVNDAGFTSILLRTRTLQDALHGIEGLPSLVVLPAGPPPPNPSELLSLDRTREFFEHAAGEVDVLIIDSPPMLPVSDPLILSGYADGVIVVTSATQSRRRELSRAAELLEQSKANVLGIVANRVSSGDRYGYGYDYEAGYGYETVAAEEADADEDVQAGSDSGEPHVNTFS